MERTLKRGVGMESVQAHEWAGEGYRPLVFSGDWQVALLNWEPLLGREGIGEIERHIHTDEVFVLWRGRGALFVATEQGIVTVEMQPGVIYNVLRGTWHGLLATRDASWIIIEARDTHLRDTEVRQMTQTELEQLRSQLPEWLD